MSLAPRQPPSADSAALVDQLARHQRWFVLTGAGCSTESGIPAYRDENGTWQHKAPIQFRDFMASAAVRQRYWARSAVGFERMRSALPNSAHRSLARLQAIGRERVLVTQNVDGLHQKAGSVGVVELHGQLARVECMSCHDETARTELQSRLLAQNPWLEGAVSLGPAPDGDAELDTEQYANVRVPECLECAGILKPAVVFFGETVPPARVASAYAALSESDALLVVGSSLTVFSGFRFVRRALEMAHPIVVINAGVTRADGFATLKLTGPCGPLLEQALDRLEGSSFSNA